MRPINLPIIVIRQHLPLAYFLKLCVFSIWITNGNDCPQPFENFLVRHLLLLWLSIGSLGLPIADLFRRRWRRWLDRFGILILTHFEELVTTDNTHRNKHTGNRTNNSTNLAEISSSTILQRPLIVIKNIYNEFKFLIISCET